MTFYLDNERYDLTYNVASVAKPPTTRATLWCHLSQGEIPEHLELTISGDQTDVVLSNRVRSLPAPMEAAMYETWFHGLECDFMRRTLRWPFGKKSKMFLGLFFQIDGKKYMESIINRVAKQQGLQWLPFPEKVVIFMHFLNDERKKLRLPGMIITGSNLMDTAMAIFAFRLLRSWLKVLRQRSRESKEERDRLCEDDVFAPILTSRESLLKEDFVTSRWPCWTLDWPTPGEAAEMIPRETPADLFDRRILLNRPWGRDLREPLTRRDRLFFNMFRFKRDEDEYIRMDFGTL
uniref:Nonstructural protein n=1 Tax=Kabuto mountain virus TaxID=1851087 RepID=A0A679CB59_9VIRU|nr:nonstructural protein [Kabuto mountain virus]